MVIGRCKVLRVSREMLDRFSSTMRKYHISIENMIYFMQYREKLNNSIVVNYTRNYDLGFDFLIYNEQFEYNDADRPDIIRISSLTLGDQIRIARPATGSAGIAASNGELLTTMELNIQVYDPEVRFCKLAKVPYWLLEQYNIYEYSDIVTLGQELIHNELIDGVRTINVEKNEYDETYDFTMFYPKFNSPMKYLYIEELNIIPIQYKPKCLTIDTNSLNKRW